MTQATANIGSHSQHRLSDQVLANTADRSTQYRQRGTSRSAAASPPVAGEARDFAGTYGANLPRRTSATMRSKPARWTPPAAEQPRSSSITSISDKSSSAGDSAWHIATHCSHGCAEPDALTIAGVEQRLRSRWWERTLSEIMTRSVSAIRAGSRRHAPTSAAQSDRSASPVSPPTVPATLVWPL